MSKPVTDLWAGVKSADLSLAVALATGSTPAAAAEQCHISERTVRRRLNDPTFRRLIAELRVQILDGALGKVAKYAVDAADRLHALLHDTNSSVCVSAARTLLNSAQRLAEALQFDERLAEIEARLSALGD